MQKHSPRAIIIGGGAGGLAVAVRLATSGFRVLVVEKNATVGGKIGQFEKEGFRWDTGPSIVTMRPVLEELFSLGGRCLADELELVAIDPMVRCHYVDTPSLSIWNDLPKTLAAIEKIEPRDVEGYLSFLAYAARIHRLCVPTFIDSLPPTWRSLIEHQPLDLLRIDPLRSVYRAICAHVRSQPLRLLLARFASYVGASPFHAPATLNVIAHAELSGSVWYPRGGFFQLALAMRRLAESVGVEIRSETAVDSLVVEGEGEGEVKGVLLADGERLDADLVVSNVDVTTTYHQLLPAGKGSRLSAAHHYGEKLVRRTPSASGLVFLWGLEGETAELGHHNMFFSSDYRREFREMVGQRQPASQPSFYVAITSKTDPRHAPAGCENWFVLVNVPPGGSVDWEAILPAYRQTILDRFRQHGIDVESRLRCEQLLQPADFETMTGAFRGALFGTSANDTFSAFLRPRNRCPHLRGLYFVGGTTHPGAGVPMVMLSAKATTRMILDDHRKSNRSTQKTHGK